MFWPALVRGCDAVARPAEQWNRGAVGAKFVMRGTCSRRATALEHHTLRGRGPLCRAGAPDSGRGITPKGNNPRAAAPTVDAWGTAGRGGRAPSGREAQRALVAGPAQCPPCRGAAGSSKGSEIRAAPAARAAGMTGKGAGTAGGRGGRATPPRWRPPTRCRRRQWPQAVFPAHTADRGPHLPGETATHPGGSLHVTGIQSGGLWPTPRSPPAICHGSWARSVTIALDP